MGIITDLDIKKLQKSETPLVSSGWNPENVNDVFLDLNVGKVISTGDEDGAVSVPPGSSVFVKTVEEFNIPADFVAFIHERTSIIRLGLSVSGASPLKPGFRGACFVRVTNLGDKAVNIKAGLGIAQLCFFKLDGTPERAYGMQKKNYFQDETEFRGLGNYAREYAKYIGDLENKKNDLEKLQGRIYMDVVAILGVFSAIIALLVTNVQAFTAEKSLGQVVEINVAILLAVAALLFFVHKFIKNGR